MFKHTMFKCLANWPVAVLHVTVNNLNTDFELVAISQY